MNRLLPFAACLCLMVNAASGQDAAIKVDYELRITDDAGRPLPDAKTLITALFLDNGVSIQWDAKPTRSDEQGVVRLDCPATLIANGQTVGVERVAGRVEHAGYAMNVFRVAIADKKSTLMLRKEATFGISAVDMNGQPIDEFGVLMSGRNRIRWIEDGNSFSRCVGIKPGKWQAIVVHPRADGKHLFSGAQSLRFRTRSDINLRNLRLRPGLTLRGKLSAPFPRPIVDGYVVACCQPKPMLDTESSDLVTWTETVPIQADGTFVFPSLPRTGRVQLVASCRDGVMSKAAPGGNGLSGVIVDLDADEQSEDDRAEVELR